MVHEGDVSIPHVPAFWLELVRGVVSGDETFRFGPGAVKKSSRAVIFPVAVGQNVFSLRASLLDEEVPLLISMGVV